MKTVFRIWTVSAVAIPSMVFVGFGGIALLKYLVETEQLLIGILVGALTISIVLLISLFGALLIERIATPVKRKFAGVGKGVNKPELSHKLY